MSFYELFEDENVIACGGLGGMFENKIINFLDQKYRGMKFEICYLPDNDDKGNE